MKKVVKRERDKLDKKVSLRVEEQKRLHQTESERLRLRIAALERKAKKTRPVAILGGWRTRWRCLTCEYGRTRTAGFWTCPSCGVEQDNQLFR